MNMSRLFTLLGRQSGYQGVLPVGRVQTPTLRLVVDRDRSIADFVPVPYWAIDVQLQSSGSVFTAQWRAPEDNCDDQGRCLNPALAKQAAVDMQAAGSAQVTKVATERVREAAPCPSTWAPCRRSAPRSSASAPRRPWILPRPCTKLTN